MGSASFRKIMIATDGSEYNRKAVNWGIELARVCEATVYAVYVLSTDYYSSMIIGPGIETLYEYLEKEGHEAVEYVSNAGKAAGVPVQEIFLEGHPAIEIIDFAETEKTDLVVMGTLGKTGIDRLLLGSVAGNVVRHCKVPVMVVREDKSP